MKEVLLNSETEFTKSFSSEDVINFAIISDDNNPIHLDEKYASESIFEQRVVHGVLLVGMFSKIFGTIFPGNGTVYMSQITKFLKPAFIDQKITARVTLTSFNNDKKRGIFTTECFNNDGDLILTGEAKVLFPKEYELNNT